MAEFLRAGIVFGLAAGFSPGPLSTLVISHTLRHGIREGLKVSLAPLITDVPIILVSCFALSRVANQASVFGVISLLGAAFLCYLAWKSFQVAALDMNVQGDPRSLLTAVAVNFLSPNPYLFWGTVGAPAVVRAQAVSVAAAAAFLTAFYVCLVGSKMVMSILAGTSRKFLAGRAYRWLMRTLAALLLVFAALLIRDSLRFFGVLV